MQRFVQILPRLVFYPLRYAAGSLGNIADNGSECIAVPTKRDKRNAETFRIVLCSSDYEPDLQHELHIWQATEIPG